MFRDFLRSRFFSAAIIFTTCLRCETRSLSSASSSLGRGLGSGLTPSAKRASTSASMASVLARRPRAFAKSRTCRGFTTDAAKPSSCSMRAARSSRPPVASSTTRSGRTRFSMDDSSPTPATRFENRNASPAGRTKTSSQSPDTSIPT